LLVDWTGEGAEVWQQRLAAASGAATVESVLRKAGVKVRQQHSRTNSSTALRFTAALPYVI
jgi:hypothetical protein